MLRHRLVGSSAVLLLVIVGCASAPGPTPTPNTTPTIVSHAAALPAEVSGEVLLIARDESEDMELMPAKEVGVMAAWAHLRPAGTISLSPLRFGPRLLHGECPVADLALDFAGEVGGVEGHRHGDAVPAGRVGEWRLTEAGDRGGAVRRGRYLRGGAVLGTCVMILSLMDDEGGPGPCRDR